MRVRTLAEPIHWAGDGAVKFAGHFSSLQPGGIAWPEAVPSMSAVAACALHRAGQGDALVTLEPIYVRRSYTELALGKPAVSTGGR